LKGPYGAYISYKGKLNVAIPKKFDYTTITRDECATLINKKKEDKKNGVKPKVFRKFSKKD
jgi:topoisomerase IA-like protein